MPMRRPRTSRICAAVNVARSWPRERDAAALDDAGGAGQQAHDGERGDGLAAARFADEPERLAGRDREAHTVDDALIAAFRVEPAA